MIVIQTVDTIDLEVVGESHGLGETDQSQRYQRAARLDQLPLSLSLTVVSAQSLCVTTPR